MPVEVIEHVWIEMRDGCRLSARLWLPEGRPAPAVLEYIPYRKRDGTRGRDEPMHGFFAENDYAAVRVDMRGTGESEGLMADEYLAQEQDDALELQLLDAPSDCPAVPARPAQSACVQSRTTSPLTVRWGGDELVLYPGEDGLLAHRGASYRVALFRNRQVAYVDPPCADYREHQRSLRIDRVEPPPVLPAPPAITTTVTASLTTTLPLTMPVPLPTIP